MSNLLLFLQEFGLSEKEAVVYQVLLDMGSASAQEIARGTKFNRSSIYMMLAKLVEQGFVEPSQQNEVLEYRAVSPEKLIERADELAQSSANKEREISSILPELLAVSNRLKNQPHVLFYEGVGGMRTVSNDLLTQPHGTQVYAFLPISNADTDPTTSLLDNPNSLRNYDTKLILPYIKTIKDTGLDKKNSSKIRCVPADLYPFSSELRIYVDKIVFISRAEEFGVIIQGQDVADVMRSLFDLAWEEAGRLDAKI